MSTELPATVTPINIKDLFVALYKCWQDLFKTNPKVESLLVLLAQISLECGREPNNRMMLKSCKNYNLGNVKANTTNITHTYFACNELLPTKTAYSLANKSPELVKITNIRSDGIATVWLYPKHAGSRFRAFNNLEEGVLDYLKLLNKRFNKSWVAVEAGNPEQFSKLLRQQNYYTADEASYTKSVVSLYKEFDKLGFQPPTTIVETSEPSATMDELTANEKQEALNLVALSLDGMVRDIHKK